MATLIELLLSLAVVIWDWHFWKWALPGSVLAALAFYFIDDPVLSWVGSISIFVYSMYRGYRADRLADEARPRALRRRGG